jgi:hypothetical protein
MKYWWLWLLPALAFTACQSSKKASYAPDQVVPTEKALLWKVSGNGVKKASYVYGTIHLIPKNELSFGNSFDKAFESTQRIAFEIDMKEMTNMRTQIGLMTKAFMAGGKTLKDLLPAEDYQFVHEKLEGKGLPPQFMERLKPMFLSTLVTSDEEELDLGGASMTSVEMELYKKSKKRSMESAGLETAAYQMAIFDSIPYEVQAQMLVETLRSGEGAGADYQKMVDMYRAQDIQSMQAMIADEAFGMEQYQHLLLDKRNQNWIPVMARMMRAKPTFFAVGAGHLGGDQGVIALLRREGFKVEAVK